MYQEVDLIDIALGSARKQCDDAKERANRLSVTVDRLRDALSRFMSKVWSSRQAIETRSRLVVHPTSLVVLDHRRRSLRGLHQGLGVVLFVVVVRVGVGVGYVPVVHGLLRPPLVSYSGV